MNKQQIAVLARDGNRFELNFPEYDLIVRGPYIEWVLEAAAEIIAKLEKTKADSAVEELEMLKEFGEMDNAEIEIDSARYHATTRFETVPQCVVQMNEMDYRWVAREGRRGDENGPVQRLLDMSLTRNGTFLHNAQ